MISPNMKFKAEGIIAAMVTPLTSDDKVNEEQLRFQVNRMIGAGVNGLFCLGTNGEFYALTEEEKICVMEIVLDENQGRLPVYAGTGCITTRETIRLSQAAQSLGADMLSIITPYFAAVSQSELIEHYTAIAAAVKIPILLYNIPARTGNHIEHSSFVRLSGVDNIGGIKDSSGNFDTTLRYIEETEGKVPVLAGNDSLILSTLLAGGTGGISGISNLFPKTVVKIYDLWKRGKIEEAKQVQKSLRPIRDTLKLGNPNSIVKRALNLLGYPVGEARKPATGSDPKINEALEKALAFYQNQRLEKGGSL